MERDKAMVVERAFALGFHQVGFGAVRRFDALGDILVAREPLEFEPRSVEHRIDPAVHFPGGKTFIALAWSYPLGRNERLGPSQVKVASSQLMDYHRVMREALETLLASLETEWGCRGKSFVDIEGLNDRAVALACGLGFRARNGHVLSPYLGTQFNIGYLIIDRALTPDPLALGNCGTCRRCVDACPGSALDGEGNVAGTRCLSYLTQKRTLTESEEKMIGRSVYGCDICQMVCPWNLALDRIETSVLEADDLLSLGSRAFKRRYGDRDFSWRGAKIIQRNVRLSLKNRR